MNFNFNPFKKTVESKGETSAQAPLEGLSNTGETAQGPARSVRMDRNGNPTVEMSNEEYAQYIEETKHNA